MIEDKKNKINQYIDTTGQLSNRHLVLGTFYLKHKLLLQKIGTGFLIAWCVVFMGFSMWKWGEYLFFGYWQDQDYLARYAQSNQNYANIQNIYKAQDLKISDIRIFATSKDMYDLLANIENPNERWIAKVSYHFNYSGGETEVQTTTIMPLSKRPAAIFGVESNSFPSSVNFVIDTVEWKSVNAHEVSDVNVFLAERNLFSIDNFIISDPSLTGVSIPSISMDIVNQSAFSYWEPVFLVELINGQQVVGYIYLYFDKILSFSTESVELRYFNQNTQFSNIRLIPIIDYFDESKYIDPGNV